MKTPQPTLCGGDDLDFLMPADLTPDQAAAVLQIVDTLRDWLWRRYGTELKDYCRTHYVSTEPRWKENPDS